MTLSWVAGQIKSLRNGQVPNSAAEWFHKRYGSALADEVALPLLEAWSGAPAEDLSPAVGDGLFGGSIAKTLYLKTAGKLTGRAVACGYNREKPETPNVWHVYPNKGVSTLCEKLAEGLEDSIKLESPVEAILVENEKVVAVRVKGEIQEVSAVISTAPANILAKLVKGTTALEGASHFRYRPMVLSICGLRAVDFYLILLCGFLKKSFLFSVLPKLRFQCRGLHPKAKQSSLSISAVKKMMRFGLWTNKNWQNFVWNISPL